MAISLITLFLRRKLEDETQGDNKLLFSMSSIKTIRSHEVPPIDSCGLGCPPMPNLRVSRD